MGERRSFFPFGFWSSTPRKNKPTRTTSATTSARKPSQHVDQLSTIDISIGSSRASSPVERQMRNRAHPMDPPPSSPPSTGLQITITSPTREPQTLSPVTLPSGSPLKSSSSLETPTATEIPKLSPSSDPPMGLLPMSPSKELRTKVQEILSSYEALMATANKDGTQPAASQEEHQMMAAQKSSGDEDLEGHMVENISDKQDSIGAKHSKAGGDEVKQDSSEGVASKSSQCAKSGGDEAMEGDTVDGRSIKQDSKEEMASKSSQQAKSSGDEALEGDTEDGRRIKHESVEEMDYKSSPHAKFGGDEALEGHTVDKEGIKQDSMDAKASQHGKSGGDEALKGDTVEMTSDKQEAVASKPSQLVTSPKSVSPPTKEEHKTLNESDEKHEDFKEQKSVAPKTKTEANEGIKTEGHESLHPNFSSESQKAQNANSDEMHVSEQNTKASEAIKMEGHKSLDPNSSSEAQKAQIANPDDMHISEQNNEANEAVKMERHESLDPQSSSEAKNIENANPDEMHISEQNALGIKEILPASLLNVGSTDITFQTTKRGTTSSAQNKSTQQGKQHFPLQKAIWNDISNLVHRVAIKGLESAAHNKPVSVVNLSGENRGAAMLLGSNPSKKEDLVHNHKGYENNPDESTEATSNGDGIFEGKMTEDAKTNEDQIEAHVNNNAQGINNSVVFSCFVTERNPGVHMDVISHIPGTNQAIGQTQVLNRLEGE